MDRKRWSGLGFVLLGLGCCLGPSLVSSEAQAFRMSVVSVTSTGASPTTLAFGDTVTIELVVENEEQRPILGIGLVAYGYDVDRNRLADDGLAMVGAEAVASIFNTARSNDGEVSGGIEGARAH